MRGWGERKDEGRKNVRILETTECFVSILCTAVTSMPRGRTSKRGREGDFIMLVLFTIRDFLVHSVSPEPLVSYVPFSQTGSSCPWSRGVAESSRGGEVERNHSVVVISHSLPPFPPPSLKNRHSPSSSLFPLPLLVVVWLVKWTHS